MPRKKTRRKPVGRKAARKSAPRKQVRKTAARKSIRKSPARRKARAKAPSRSLRPTPAPKRLTSKDVDSLWSQLQSEERSEKAWQAMTAAAPSDKEDRWNQVQDDLIQEASSKDQNIRRWKYFAK
ncbi:MAG: hypothetical protein WCU88_07540 [Elusimicrobiota bacterium]|jgi:hypothetical protein